MLSFVTWSPTKSIPENRVIKLLKKKKILECFKKVSRLLLSHLQRHAQLHAAPGLQPDTLVSSVHDQHVPSVFYELDTGVHIISDTVFKHPNNLMLELLASTPFPDQENQKLKNKPMIGEERHSLHHS